MTDIKDSYISEGEFQLLRELIKKEFGLQIKGDKRLTLHARLAHRLHILGLTSYADYCNFVRADSSGAELQELASHVTNNETFFFREKAQFDIFSHVLEDIKKEKQKKKRQDLKILSLACSTGEEAYTLNILVQLSGLFLWNWDVRITGIDISRIAVEKAKKAIYSKNSFRGINGESGQIQKYFTCEGELYRLKQPFAKNVEFRLGNIMCEDAYAGLEGADAVFCRNLFIYMSPDAIGKVLVNCYRSLSDTGYLFVGSSESLINKTDLFIPRLVNGVIVYRKNVKKN
ncbi:MAG: protein-glutamate O-methyltransferase CheR [Nitrospirota bacterium]|nr:protein-glutamate O-methyltransferase CheR [Nitrospirota bacterium]